MAAGREMGWASPMISRVLVAEDIRGVVEDDIEEAIDSLLVCGIDQVA